MTSSSICQSEALRRQSVDPERVHLWCSITKGIDATAAGEIARRRSGARSEISSGTGTQPGSLDWGILIDQSMKDNLRM